MRDQHSGRTRGLDYIANLKGQSLSQADVKIGKWLVQKKKLWFGRQGTRQRNPLLLSARQFMDVTFSHCVQPYHLQHFLHPLLTLFGIQRVQPKTHIALHIEMRKQRIVLKYHADLALLSGNLRCGATDFPAHDADAPLGDRCKTGKRPQQGGLAAARGPQQAGYVALLQAQRHVVYHWLGLARVAHGDALQFHRCNGAWVWTGLRIHGFNVFLRVQSAG